MRGAFDRESGLAYPNMEGCGLPSGMSAPLIAVQARIPNSAVAPIVSAVRQWG